MQKVVKQLLQGFLGTLFLFQFSGVVTFNTWLISSWEENKFLQAEQINAQDDIYFTQIGRSFEWK